MGLSAISGVLVRHSSSKTKDSKSGLNRQSTEVCLGRCYCRVVCPFLEFVPEQSVATPEYETTNLYVREETANLNLYPPVSFPLEVWMEHHHHFNMFE